MCLVRSIFANLCPIMMHLKALDFNVCRFEEVISFFWRSVYKALILYSPQWDRTHNFVLLVFFFCFFVGWYLYIDATQGSPNSMASVFTPTLHEASPSCVIEYWKHMYGTGMLLLMPSSYLTTISILADIFLIFKFHPEPIFTNQNSIFFFFFFIAYSYFFESTFKA